MLTPLHLATIRAALLFWREEIAVADPYIALPYFDVAHESVLSATEVESLREQLHQVKYVLVNQRRSRVGNVNLLSFGSAIHLGGPMATVILPPPDRSQTGHEFGQA